MDSKHTIVLLQVTPSYDSRIYMDYESVNVSLDALVKLYEAKLAELNPSVPKITYTVADLNAFLDTYHDLSCLVFEPSSGSYQPHDRNWIKSKILQHIKHQAGK